MRYIWQSAVLRNAHVVAAIKRNSTISVSDACDAVFALQDTVNTLVRARAGVPVTIRHLLRVIDFAGSHGASQYTFAQNVVLGCRFLVADQLYQSSNRSSDASVTVQASELERAATEWKPRVMQKLHITDVAWYTAVFSPPTLGQCTRALEVLGGSPGYIRCGYTGVVAAPRCPSPDTGYDGEEEAKGVPADDASASPGAEAAAAIAPAQVDADATKQLRAKTRMTFTPTMLLNVARILAAQVSRAPLLLEGPPGIGT